MKKAFINISVFLFFLGVFLFAGCKHIVYIENISIQSLPIKTEYFVGEKLDVSGLVITKTTENGELLELTSKDIVVEPANETILSVSGDITVNVSYAGKNLSFFVHVKEVIITQLLVTSFPKTSYYVGDKIDFEGLQLEAMFNDGHTEIITDVMEFKTEPALGSIFETPEKTQIVITYLNKQVTYFVDVTNPIFGFAIQPENSSFPLYSENQNLSATVAIDDEGTVIFEWYRKNPNESEFIKFYTSEAITVESSKFYKTEVKLLVNHYVKSDYKCKTIFQNGVTEKIVESNTVTVEQTVDTGLPLLRINTFDGNFIISKQDYVSATFSLSSDDYEDLVLEGIKIKGRGNSSWNQPKKPYTLKFDKKNKVLGMAKSKKWVLVANYSDKSLLRNDFVSYLGNNIFNNMEWNPSFKFVDFILNNEYEGTYILGEQIKIEENRVNIQNIADTVLGKGKDLNGDGIVNEKDGGFIFEVNTTRMDEAYNYRTTRGFGMSLKDPDVEDFISNEMPVESFMAAILQVAEDTLYSAAWLDTDNGYSKYLDVDSFIDWYIANEFTKNNDACWFSSVYLYYNPETKKLYMGPDWDFDISCGNINYNDCDNYEGFWIKDSGWYRRLFTDKTFITNVKKRWNIIREDLDKAIKETIQEKSVVLTKSAELNFNRWNILGKYVSPNANGYNERTTYKSEVDYLYDWLQNRFLWMDSAINNL